jgi:putative ABC transport system permease protein
MRPNWQNGAAASSRLPTGEWMGRLLMDNKLSNGSLSWKLAWTLATRELGTEMTHGFKGLRIFLICVFLGVATIAAVGSLSQSLTEGLKADGAKLLGGDVDLRLLHRPATEEQRHYLKSNSSGYSEIVKMRAMARPVDNRDKRAMVELKAVDSLYPLIGSLVTKPAGGLDTLLENRNGVWGAIVDANLLDRLNLSIGDTIKVGAATYQMRATVSGEPDRVANVFTFGPRLLVAAGSLEATELIQPGSQIRYHHRLLLDRGTNLENWKADLSDALPKAGWRVRAASEAAPGVRRFIERMTLFLSFVGLTVLLVGGLGITGAVKSYLNARLATVATLKCLGAPGALVFRIYLIQIILLGLLAIAAGLIIGGGVPIALFNILADQLPVQPVIGLYSEPLILAASFGLLSAVTFAIWPIAAACRVKPAELFRARISPIDVKPQKAYRLATIAGVVALAVLCILSANDRFFAYWFVGGSALTWLLLRGGAALVMRCARRMTPPANALWRLAQANLHRPGAATPGVVVSMGLGLSVLVAIALIEGNLKHQISERLPDRAPAFFFVDIQTDQVEAFDKAVTGINGTSGYQRVPTLRGRIVKIDGTAVEKASVDQNVQWAIRGDRALTFAADKHPQAKITKGDWWAPDYTGAPIISLDAGLAKGFGIDIGDTLTLNILGREITATIINLREIDWRSLRFDFAIIFAPGTLEGAPLTHIAAIEAGPAIEEAVEKAATDPFPNISAIRVRDALEAAGQILAGIGTAITGTAGLTILAGAVVLAGVIASEHQRRVYDAIVFKVLGATRRRILAVYLLEYGALGLLTGLISAAVGTLIGWAVVRFLMRAEWTFLGDVVAITITLCIIVILTAGLLSTWQALGQKAALHLRDD